MSTSQTVGAGDTSAAPRTRLRRELRFWEAIALSIGISGLIFEFLSVRSNAPKPC